MEASARSWLATACAPIRGARSAVLHLRAAGRGSFPALARWPEQATASPGLEAAVLQSLEQRRPCVEASDAAAVVAIPLLRAGELIGAAGVELEAVGKPELLRVARRLAAAAPWLELVSSAGPAPPIEPAELLASVTGATSSRDAATTIASQLAARLGAERVAIGLLERERVRLVALSHSARFDPRSRSVLALEAALQEALDQECEVSYPPAEGARTAVAHMHERLARGAPGAVQSVPFALRGEPVGALLAQLPGEHGDQAGAREALRAAAELVGPLLALRRQAERPLRSLARERARVRLARLLGPGHLALKLAAALVAAALVIGLLPFEHRVGAPARVEGRVQRAVVAAIDGFVLEADARAGDVVQAGQTLAALDDRDLRLEQAKWQSEREQARKALREARAQHERTRAAILAAELAQAEAELALVEAQLARTTLVAPFEGIVVEGDLSQSLGSPVERGDVLFEIAPLDDWRVILEVDERDVGRVEAGTRGTLVLAAAPGQGLELAVERVTPVANAADGRNFFRVEARLDAPDPTLRPGLEGHAKLSVGRRPLLASLLERPFETLRLAVWGWLP